MFRLPQVVTYGFTLICLSSYALAVEYTGPMQGEDLIGEMKIVKTKYEDTFSDLEDKYSLGHSQMIAANPGVDPWIPGEGTDVLLPTRYILPNVPRDGIVINLPEYRLYYFPKGTNTVYTFPLGIGREGWGSPLGNTKITTKIKDPSWYPPTSIRKEHAEDGDILPSVVPPGPDNPLGPYKMNLSFQGYLIHGSNQNFGVGTRTSHGCFRMLNPDLLRLVSMVPIGTKVNIINQPYKVGIEKGKLYLEAHEPLKEYAVPDVDKLISAAKTKYNISDSGVDMSITEMVSRHHDGIPVQVGNVNGTPMKHEIPQIGKGKINLKAANDEGSDDQHVAIETYSTDESLMVPTLEELLEETHGNN